MPSAQVHLLPPFSVHSAHPATVVLIADHLALPNLAGPLNALFGPTLSPDYPRFVPLSDAYSRRVRKAVLRSAYELAQEGVFGTRPGACLFLFALNSAASLFMPPRPAPTLHILSPPLFLSRQDSS